MVEVLFRTAVENNTLGETHPAAALPTRLLPLLLVLPALWPLYCTLQRHEEVSGLFVGDFRLSSVACRVADEPLATVRAELKQVREETKEEDFMVMLKQEASLEKVLDVSLETRVLLGEPPLQALLVHSETTAPALPTTRPLLTMAAFAFESLQRSLLRPTSSTTSSASRRTSSLLAGRRSTRCM